MNRQIKAFSVRLIDEEGKQIGVVSLKEALALAEEKGLDLVEIAPNANPPVCKIIDWGRFQYEQKKKEKSQKNKAKETKQLRISFRISPHDLEVKLKQASKFLEKKHKIKISILLKGREITKIEEAKEKLKNIALSLQAVGEIEEGPKSPHPRLVYIVLKPKSV